MVAPSEAPGDAFIQLYGTIIRFPWRPRPVYLNKSKVMTKFRYYTLTPSIKITKEHSNKLLQYFVESDIVPPRREFKKVELFSADEKAPVGYESLLESSKKLPKRDKKPKSFSLSKKKEILKEVDLWIDVRERFDVNYDAFLKASFKDKLSDFVAK